MVREVLIGVHDIQVGGHFINGLGVRGFRRGRRRGVGVSDVVGVLVSGLVGFDGCMSFGSRMIPSGTSDFVADETFIVSEVFCSLRQS